MKAARSGNGNSRRRLTVMLLVVLLPPAVTLIWLGLRLLAQDRMIEAQHEIDRRQAAAESIARSFIQSISELQNSGPGAQMPEGAVRLVVSKSGISAEPKANLLWRQTPPQLPEAATEPFVDAERAEFQGAPESALRRYRELAHSAVPAIRAGALLRAARVERNARRPDQALDDYRSLAAIRGIAFNTAPIDFVARRAICSVLKEAQRSDQLHREATALETDFLSNRWPLDRSSWELAAGEIEQWTGRPPAVSAAAKSLSLAADWIFQNSNALPGSGNRRIFVEDKPITIVWRTVTPQSETSQFEALALTPEVIRTWSDKATHNSAFTGKLRLLTDADEGITETPERSMAKLSSAATGLPWTLVLSTDKESTDAGDLGRRRLLMVGLAAIVLLLAGGSYFLWRVVERELAVARLQADFVAAVSHEFRTPLTSLRHITELLEEDDGSPPGPERERRKTFYSALGRNTERLHRLVESLLDFSRMETGRKPWHLAPMDAGILTAQVVSQFQKEVEANGVRVDVSVESPAVLRLRADADALSHALWNLLDNAVKYSPSHDAVHVSVGRNNGRIVIAVKDEGLGIPAGEQRQIFQKFVRGEKASGLGIKGTGLGLAMVSHIAEAHGGSVELESEEGKGSTFRLVLPAEA